MGQDMITINGDKGLIRINGWEDIIERPGFNPDLNPVLSPLKAIIGRYVFGDQVRCGLANCHTPHNRGYIVTTEDRQETNIGADCGKTYFSVDFDEMERTFNRDVNAMEDREFLHSLAFRVQEIDRQISDLRSTPKGANWVNKYCTALRDPRSVPTAVTRQFDQFIKANSGKFTLERVATEEEALQRDQVSGRRLPRPVYVIEFEADIRGVEALYDEYDLRKILVVDLQEKLGDFKKVKIDELTEAELKHWKKWAVQIEQKLEVAGRAVELGQTLLTHQNLAPLLRAPGLGNQDEYDRFKKFLDKL